MRHKAQSIIKSKHGGAKSIREWTSCQLQWGLKSLMWSRSLFHHYIEGLMGRLIEMSELDLVDYLRKECVWQNLEGVWFCNCRTHCSLTKMDVALRTDEASPGCTSLSVSQACEADWYHLKTAMGRNVRSQGPGKSLDAVMAAVEARFTTPSDGPTLSLHGFSSRVLSGSGIALCSEQSVPCARDFLAACPENMRVFDCKDVEELKADLEFVYVMPVTRAGMTMDMDSAAIMFVLLRVADKDPLSVSQLHWRVLFSPVMALRHCMD